MARSGGVWKVSITLPLPVLPMCWKLRGLRPQSLWVAAAAPSFGALSAGPSAPSRRHEARPTLEFRDKPLAASIRRLKCPAPSAWSRWIITSASRSRSPASPPNVAGKPCRSDWCHVPAGAEIRKGFEPGIRFALAADRRRLGTSLSSGSFGAAPKARRTRRQPIPDLTCWRPGTALGWRRYGRS